MNSKHERLNNTDVHFHQNDNVNDILDDLNAIIQPYSEPDKRDTQSTPEAEVTEPVCSDKLSVDKTCTIVDNKQNATNFNGFEKNNFSYNENVIIPKTTDVIITDRKQRGNFLRDIEFSTFCTIEKLTDGLHDVKLDDIRDKTRKEKPKSKDKQVFKVDEDAVSNVINRQHTPLREDVVKDTIDLACEPVRNQYDNTADELKHEIISSDNNSSPTKKSNKKSNNVNINNGIVNNNSGTQRRSKRSKRKSAFSRNNVNNYSKQAQNGDRKNADIIPHSDGEVEKSDTYNEDHDDHGDVFAKSNETLLEFNSKYNQKKNHSILKKSRSFSESSCDEKLLSSCYSQCYLSENETSASDCHSVTKKTVRFNDVISKKLYSSDISIVMQEKRARRRSLRRERKASESDNSETEDYVKKRDAIDFYNSVLYQDDVSESEVERSSISESGDETSDDQRSDQETERVVKQMPCSKKGHKKHGKKSARKNASTKKYQYVNEFV